jgi:hypothetical protein
VNLNKNQIKHRQNVIYMSNLFFKLFHKQLFIQGKKYLSLEVLIFSFEKYEVKNFCQNHLFLN